MTPAQDDIQQGGPILLKGRCWPDGAWREVRIDGGRFAGVREVPPETEPAGERWVVPGFFDLQVNGFAGRGFLSPALTIDDVRHVARAVLATGCTRFLPTIITAPLPQMCRELSTIAEAIERDPLVAQMCPRIHVEGPFIHPDDGPRGAHPREYVRDPDVAEFEQLRAAARGHLRMITLAPDRPGAAELIRAATAQGVLVSLGHHRADQAALDAAIAAGARMCTHLGNGSDAVLPRLDNPVWRQLGDDRLLASFIADGHHLPAPTLRAMLRAKTVARSILITDAVAAAGMPPGRYPLGGIEVELTSQGRMVLPGTPYLAGSAADMPTVIARAIADGGLTFVEAIQAAAVNPAGALGLPLTWLEPAAPAHAVELEWSAATATLCIRRAVAGRFATSAE